MDLAPDLARTAAAELGETPEHRDRCLVRVKEELLKAPEEARPARMDDAYILRFLRSRKFDVPKALRVLLYRAFYDRHHPHLVRDLRAEEFRDFYKQGFLRLLSGYDQQGRLIGILLPTRLDVVDATTIMRWVVWVTDAMADDPHMQVNGIVLIQDFDGYTLRRHMQVSNVWSASQLRSIFHFIQRCAPYRLGAVHVVKQPAFMSFVWAIMRPFMQTKLRQRIHFHGNRLYGLLDSLSPQMLPPELGGTLEEDPMAWFEEQASRERAQRAASLELDLSADVVRSQAVIAGLAHPESRSTTLQSVGEESASTAPKGYPPVRPYSVPLAHPESMADPAPPQQPFEIADVEGEDSEDIDVYPAVQPVTSERLDTSQVRDPRTSSVQPAQGEDEAPDASDPALDTVAAPQTSLKSAGTGGNDIAAPSVITNGVHNKAPSKETGLADGT